MLPRHLVSSVIARDGGFCLLALPGCLGPATIAHHRANRGSGGSRMLDDPVNLVAACGPCNGAAEDAHAIVRGDLIARGLRVEKAATNEATLERARRTPVETLDGERWLLLSATQRQLVEIVRERF